ncbi:hypothetical protein DGo_PC0073 (plasmid) [Deinococcus gobiensis I-0]|uniref:Uncharacterized protein n=1 Tax=Deinococcus gobiensis (strain DSM 21396 / JCM 16679 / CGMCC 1.7299 / I-0) TaxID=745776 RepID=H8H2W8_DEIGI|nr:hypothetical protein DGo_PC0073 [Deinococcus gobiensis I-0]
MSAGLPWQLDLPFSGLDALILMGKLVHGGGDLRIGFFPRHTPV